MSNQNNRLRLAQTTTVAITAMAAVFTTTAANAQSPATMAPPVSGSSGTFNANGGGSGGAPTGQNVFQWQDVPQNRQVPITRAVFDQGGYQLFDDTGETIVVPFANQNLYVMRFGQTSGSMYFVNDGSTPTLYIPRGGYLENASAQGARWYPFPQSYSYTAPVYVGPAPSWSDYYAMGWYPGMVYYGGYYGYHPWSFGVAFSPFPGLYFSIGGHPYYGWNSYHNYYSYHTVNRVYIRDEHRFGGYGVRQRGPSYFASHPSHFGGYGSHYTAFHGSPSHFGGGNVASHSFGHTGGSFGGANHNFGGGSHSFGGGANRSFGTTTHTTTTTRTFRGGLGGGTAGGGHVGGGSFGGGGHTGGGSFGGGGNRTFTGGSGGGHVGGGSFGGGGGHAGGGSFGGGGGHAGGSFGGGGGHASGGSPGGGGGGHAGGGGGGGHH